MNTKFMFLDWIVFIGYFALSALLGFILSRRKVSNMDEYFLAKKQMPLWAVAISLLATTQSAATFLGGPGAAYGSNLTYLSTNIGYILGILLVAYFFIPRFYENRVMTVYQLLHKRYGAAAQRATGIWYFFGRVFASGARLYMAAIAMSMVLFFDIAPTHILLSTLLLVIVGIAYAYFGGIRSVIWSDVVQLVIYVSAALIAIISLYLAFSATPSEVISALQTGGAEGNSKLKLFDFQFSGFTDVYTVWTSLTGFVLLSVASHALDQDMTQRLLTCKSAKQGAMSAVTGALISLPVTMVFMFVGLFLYIFYNQPDLLRGNYEHVVDMSKNAPQTVQIFMYYMLNEMPAGIKGLMTIGVMAAAVSTLNSGLNAMSSVLVNDFYKPIQEKRGLNRDSLHYVKAGRIGVIVAAVLLGTVSVLSYYMQQASKMPLLNFALSMMVFAYTGLLGVFSVAMFTKRGNNASAIAALCTGFVFTVLMQPYIWKPLVNDLLGITLPNPSFPWVLVFGTLLAALVCFLGKPKESASEEWDSQEGTQDATE